MFSAPLARWTTPDPLADKYYSTSPYAFSGNNPVNYVDPDGRVPGFVIGAIIGGGVGSLVEQVLNKAFGNEDEINITEITVDSGFGAITGSIDGCGEALKNTIKSTQYQKNLTEQILSSSNTKITTKKAKSEVKEIITVEDKLVDKTTEGITNTLDLYYNLESE